MSNIYFYADPHFGHSSTIHKFKRPDGSPLRPFTSVEEMNFELKKRYKETVKHNDQVYFLGDLVMDNQLLDEFLHDLPGQKYLIQGNHDTAPASVMLKYFRDIKPSGFRRKELILSHIPLYDSDYNIRGKCNVTGHLHANIINNPSYLCVSVEQTDYRPISIDEVRNRIKINQLRWETEGSLDPFQFLN